MELIMLVTYRMLTGEGKEECEDSALIYDRGSRELLHGGNGSTRIEEPCIIAIADGVGGNPGGRDASTFAMNALLEQFSDLEVPFDAGQIRDKIRQINCDLVSYSSDLHEKAHMATTFTALFCCGGRIVIAHAGNTRLNALNNCFLKQLNTDHSTYQYLRDIGDYEASERCNKSEIYSFLGGGDPEGLRRLEIKVLEKDQIPEIMILTSDGIHEYVELDDFEDLMADGSVSSEQKTASLVEMALENFSLDDKTVLIIERNGGQAGC